MAAKEAEKSAPAKDYDYTTHAPAYTAQFLPMLDQYNKLIDVAKIKEGESVLDVACGTGMVGYLVMERKLVEPWQVCFADENKEMLIQAQRALVAKFGPKPAGRVLNFDFNSEDARTKAKELFGRPEGFDVVLANNIVGTFTNSSKHHALAALLDFTTPGGRVVFDYAAPSPSAHMEGKPEWDMMVWGVRTIVLPEDAMEKPFQYVSGGFKPPVEEVICSITDREADWAKQKLVELADLANARVVESEETFQRHGVENVSSGWWEKALATGKKQKNKKKNLADGGKQLAEKQMADVDWQRRLWVGPWSDGAAIRNALSKMHGEGTEASRLVFSFAVVATKGQVKQ